MLESVPDSLTSGDGVNPVPGGPVLMDASDIGRVAVLGAGNMGHGITEAVAIAGYDVTMRDVEGEFVDSGYEDIEWSLDKLDEKGRIDEYADDVLDRAGRPPEEFEMHEEPESEPERDRGED